MTADARQPLPPLPPLPEAAERVANHLAQCRAEARLHEFREGAPTAEAAARAVGCQPSQIVKSLVFVCDGAPVLVMVPGSRRADDQKLAATLRAALVRIAKPAYVLERTGFKVGGVAPFPLPRVQVAVLDQSMLRHEIVWVGAGTSQHMAELEPVELLRLTKARVGDVSADLAG